MSINNKIIVSLLFVIAAMYANAQPLPSSSVSRPRLKVGLVLGGGGAKGAAEVGALKVIEQSGIPIDYIAGTSIGAIVGGLYACGYKSDTLEKFFCSQDWLNLLSNRNAALSDRLFEEDDDGNIFIMGFPVYRKKKAENGNTGIGLLSGNAVTQMLDSLTKKYDNIGSFDNLPIPFRCVAVDLMTQEEVVMDSCELEFAMRASMAIPGVFRPLKWKDYTLVDGGMMNNLPVDVVKALGADVVIAVDLLQDKHEDHDFSLKDLLGIGGLADWLLSRPDWKKYNANVALADVCISPELAEFSALGFSLENVKEMLVIGEDAAQEKWDELLQLKERIYSEAVLSE